MAVTPYSSTYEGKKEQVEKMFNQIAFRYDLLNQLLSFGTHKGWRKKAIRLLSEASATPPQKILDVATGTADFAIDAVALKPQSITGVDISEEMLALGRKKSDEKKLSGLITLTKADSEALPFPDSHFDAATVGFGVRNFENLEKGLSEIARTLKKGGTLAVLESSMPERFPIKQLYNFYLGTVCPITGRIISGDGAAYSYLFRSISAFPYGERFNKILTNCGFSSAVAYPQTFGVATIYIAKK